MADSYIPVAGTDKKLQGYENTVDGELVISEAVTPTDQSGAPFTQNNRFPVEGLVAARFYGTALTTPDTSGNGRDGTLSGTTLPQQVSSPAGTAFRDALYFDGVNLGANSCGVNCGTSGTGLLSPFCIEFQVRRDRLGVIEFILGRWSTSPTTERDYLLYFDSADDKLYGVVAGTASTPAVGSLAAVPIGTYEVALTWDGTTLRLYLDGALQSSAALPDLQAPDDTIPLWIGRDADGAFPFKGVVDDVRLSSVVRYTGATYTPTGAPLEADADTEGLWPLDTVYGPISVDTGLEQGIQDGGNVVVTSSALPAGAATAANQQTNALTDAELRATPVPVRDDLVTIEHESDQVGAGAVLTFTLTAAAHFVMVDVDNTSSSDTATYLARATLDGSTPTAVLGFVCRSGQTSYLPFGTTATTVKVFAPTGCTVSVQTGRR